jgi:hypothetical protein
LQSEDNPAWLKEFGQGTHKETYRVPMGLQFEGMLFEQVRSYIYIYIYSRCLPP